ncbi:ABC transporter substrate-binding protein [Clostridium sp. Marseille-Q7071]
MNKNLFKKFIVATMVGAMTFTLIGCTKKDSDTETVSILEKVKESKKLVIGTSADYPPYEFHKEINGKDEIVGFDITIAKELAKDLGVELKISDMSFDGLLPALKTGKIDMALASMNPSEERKESVDFSDIYYKAQHGIIVRKEDKDKYPDLDSLAGKKIGVQKGSIQQQFATSQIKDADLKGLSKITDLIMELKNNKVDAVAIELPVGEFYAERNPDLAMTTCEFKTEEDLGAAIAVKKGEADFIEEINKTLNRLIKEGKISEFIVEANKMVE